jgi:hypothetical protein
LESYDEGRIKKSERYTRLGKTIYIMHINMAKQKEKQKEKKKD